MGGEFKLGVDEALVLNYMRRQNRPYNALTLSDNLRGAVKKTACQKALDTLSSAGLMLKKDYNKQGLYLVQQQPRGDENDDENDGSSDENDGNSDENDGNGDGNGGKGCAQELRAGDVATLRGNPRELGAAGLSKLEGEVEAAKGAVTGLASDVEMLEKRVSASSKRLPVEDIERRAAELEAENTSLRAELGGSDDAAAASGITEADVEKLEKRVLDARKKWKQRKRLCNEILDTMADGMGKKRKKLAEEIGVETDEEVKVSLDNYENVE